MISVNPRKPLILGLMKLFFSNVPGCTTYTWIRMVSATRVSLEIYEQLFFGTFQNSCSNYLARPIFAFFYKTQHLSCSICFSFLRRCLPFVAHLCKIKFDIPEAHLKPSQLFKMELFAKIVTGFLAINIFAKCSILDV